MNEALNNKTTPQTHNVINFSPLEKSAKLENSFIALH